MDKPIPIKEVFVHFWQEKIRLIAFSATPDMLDDFQSFGKIFHTVDRYELNVSGHYDFQQVLQYIKSKQAN